MKERKSPAPTFPDAEYVGRHLVIDKTEWVPGGHPEPHLREDGQTAYPETYFRCVRCGAERLSKDDFPEECGVPEARDARAACDGTPGDGVSTGHGTPPEFDVTGVSD